MIDSTTIGFLFFAGLGLMAYVALIFLFVTWLCSKIGWGGGVILALLCLLGFGVVEEAFFEWLSAYITYRMENQS